jgi:nucleotide-binding universal stress UspA family protein
VLGELVTPPALPTIWDDEVDKMKSYLESVAERLRGDGLQVDVRVDYGPAADVILRVADAIHADLVVMATHGRSGLPRLWLGSVAMKTVQVCHRPVLLVRAQQESKRVEHPAQDDPAEREKHPVG